MPVDSFSGILPEEWDAARPMRRRPSALVAADDIARLERANGELQAALEEALGRVAELEAALKPLAEATGDAVVAESRLKDDLIVLHSWGVAEHYEVRHILLGDVRRARALLRGDGK